MGWVVPSSEENTLARLLYGSMMFAVTFDGRMSHMRREAVALLCQTTPELQVDRSALQGVSHLLVNARTLPQWMRDKAFALSVEAVLRGDARERPTGQVPLAFGPLRTMLGISEDVAQETLRACSARFEARISSRS